MILLLLGSTLAWGAGGIDVVTDPPGASIRVDGRPTGQTSPATIMDLPAGVHQVEALSGCLAGRTTVEVLDGGVAQVTVPMVQQSGMLQLQLDPIHAKVELDGAPFSFEPNVPMAVDCGEHQLRVTADGHAPAVVRVNVTARTTTTLPVQLDPASMGWLDVDVAPTSARLWLDDRSVGTGPQRLEVIAGPHVLRAAADGYQTVERNVVAQPDTTMPIAFSLEPVAATTSNATQVVDDGKRKRRPWIGLTVAGLGAASLGYGVYEYTQAQPGWDAFQDRKEFVEAGNTPNGWAGTPEDWAYQVYDDEVAPRRTRMIIADVVGGVLLSSGIVLTFAL